MLTANLAFIEGFADNSRGRELGELRQSGAQGQAVLPFLQGVLDNTSEKVRGGGREREGKGGEGE